MLLKRHLTAALMMLSAGPDEPLPWASGVIAKKLAALVLAGQWQQNNPKDREAVAELAGVTEKELEAGFKTPPRTRPVP